MIATTFTAYSSGWMFVKEKENNNYMWVDSTAYDSITMINYTTIAYISDFGNKLKDYVFVRNKIIELCDIVGFSNLKDNAKEVVAQYCAINMDTLVIYYMGKGMSQNDAIIYYLSTRSEQIDKTADSYCNRINSDKMFIQMMMFLGEEQALTFMSAIRNFKQDLCDYALLGTQYGDSKDGLMDFIEQTGSYTNGGSGNFVMSDSMVAVYGSQELALQGFINNLHDLIIDKSVE